MISNVESRQQFALTLILTFSRGTGRRDQTKARLREPLAETRAPSPTPQPCAIVRTIAHSPKPNPAKPSEKRAEKFFKIAGLP